MSKSGKAAAFVSGALFGAAIATELAKPEDERTWHGKIEDFVPYDLRVPTTDRLRASVWDPESDEILVPRAWGVGWSINFSALLRRIRGIPSSSPRVENT